MKKRVFAAILATTLVLVSVMGVSAANSKEAGVTVTNKEDAADTYEIQEVPAASVEAVGGQEVIENLNKGVVTDLPKDIAKELEGKTSVSFVYDLSVETGDHAQCKKQGYHLITLVADGLTKDMDKDSVRILHFDMVEKKWEVIKPESVDLAKKTIVAKFTNLSPVVIFAETVDSKPEGTAPNMGGMSSAWMLWAALAVVAIGSAVVVSKKKNR